MRILLLSIDTADRLVRCAPVIIITAALLVVVQYKLPLQQQYALISSLFLLSLGVHAGSLRKWRVESGLWMLATLGTIVGGAVFLTFALPGYQRIIESLFAQAPQQPLPAPIPKKDFYYYRWAIDAPIGMTIYWLQIKLCYTIGRCNYHVSQIIKTKGETD